MSVRSQFFSPQGVIKMLWKYHFYLHRKVAMNSDYIISATAPVEVSACLHVVFAAQAFLFRVRMLSLCLQ